ncbi:helix-hairpin-helix domain-containing protein [Deinococcus yavapaiensis]|uniref:DNA polymerase (Family 10) n=1 Tax=Deinococcus yavapaiensis KR-236 TaxID=694435 RepID=A0A318S343_9DEIO|nr:helix-hairpin-helix domain-containing protein [Deinococcus yavapaiensis]PYE52921.1 DNA polymerase (family 10) [Deinococcus yavapaiensis KR-236]
MDKKSVVNVLKATADLLELLGEDGFRVSAYRAAARSFEAIEDFDDVAARGFRGVPKVGATLGAELRTFAQTGALPTFEDAAAQVPPGVLSLFRVRGLGPKKIGALWSAGIDSLEVLREACLDGRVAALKGFGAKSQASILESVEFALRVAGRQHLSTAVSVAEKLCQVLEAFEPRFAGGLRRGMESVESVDLTVTARREEVEAALKPLVANLAHSDATPVWSGDVNGVPIEVGYAARSARGAIDLVQTGGAYRDLAVGRAEELGLSLTGAGLKRGLDVFDTPTERDVVARLDLDFVPPPYREVEHAGVSGLPSEEALVGVSDVLGLLHTHSTWSDGASSVRDMAAETRRLYGADAYLGTGDHSRGAAYANGMSVDRLLAQIAEVRALQAEGFKILAGAEVDILEDGSLDYPDDVLERLDYVVASVHSLFQMSRERQTERLVRAVSHPLVTILGHPTGRLLLRRPSYDVDLDAVMSAASERGTVIEINANAYRLDLDWREALKWRGRVKFAINTDAHVPSGLRDVRFGVMVARKAGLTRDDVVNCLSYEDFASFAKRKRSGA